MIISFFLQFKKQPPIRHPQDPVAGLDQRDVSSAKRPGVVPYCGLRLL